MLKKKITHWSDDSMIKIERISWILSPAISVPKNGKYMLVPDDDPELHVSEEDNPENWHVQVSILAFLQLVFPFCANPNSSSIIV